MATPKQQADPARIYRQLNRAQKGQWTRIARTFSMAHANKVMAARIAPGADL